MTSPKALLDELCKEATPRKEFSLRLIFRLCEEQHARGSRDYSVTTIGELSKQQGGPSSAAIRNKTGEAYRALLQLYAASVGGKAKKTRDHVRTEDDNLLEGVSDPVLRTRIKLLMTELTAMRGQEKALRHLVNNSTVLVLDNPGAQAKSQADSQDHKLKLTEMEDRALRTAISDKTLKHWGWSADHTGRILTDQGQTIFPAGFVTAIQKILAVE